MAALRPSCREDFKIAIICALPLEYNAVALLFDEFWDGNGDRFGRAASDDNTYKTGRIGQHSVVLALLPGMGKVNAAAAAASMRSSYVALRLVLLVGICGGAPRCNKDEILLGDVIISKTVIQYDFGRQLPDGFVRKDKPQDDLRKPNKDILAFLATFETDLGRDNLEKKTAKFLRQLQGRAGIYQTKYKYPGTAEDKLFDSGYRHKHHTSSACICSNCKESTDPVCAGALASACDDLGCDETYLVKRARLDARQQLEQGENNKAQGPVIYIGTVASGDTVMKSGQDRDRIVEKEGVIAFEMEGAGAWEEVPCIVVKGVCDYADCHKNKKWQDFAAATAASASKALLEQYIQTDKHRGPVTEEPLAYFLVPFGRNQGFVGRETILRELRGRIWPGTSKDNCQRIAVEGLGGVGKTQIALEAIYRLHEDHPDCSIFWVPAVDANTFENAYRNIGKHMKIEGLNEEQADIKQLVKTKLSDDSSGSWLLVIDNADDIELLFDVIRLPDYLPFSRKGSILFTTRNHKATASLGVLQEDIVRVLEMDRSEASDLLRKGLNKRQMKIDPEHTERLLESLTYLPLAIRQASAYMDKNHISPSEYLKLFESEPEDTKYLLSRDFNDPHRYDKSQNAVAKTWHISFEHILKNDPLATQYLKFMSLLAEKDIPRSLLPTTEEIKVPTTKEIKDLEAIGTLKAYAFIAQREGQDSFDMHRLDELEGCVSSAIQQLSRAFPLPTRQNRNMLMKYLPHAQAALDLGKHLEGERVDARLSFLVAASYELLGNYQKAEQMYWQTLQLDEKDPGKEYLYTLHSMNNLANVLLLLGKHEEALQMHQQTLQLREKVLGKEHPDTLYSMNHFANLLCRLGQDEKALQMHQQTLQLCEKTLQLREKVLGKEHPDTLHSMNYFASLLCRLGQDEKAQQMHQQTLQLREKVLGKEHPDTLISMKNLSFVLSLQGKHEEAEQLQQQMLPFRKKVLGEEQPDILHSYSDFPSCVKYSVGRNLDSC
ncbi:Tetratricopeptide-like helical [Metarhizium album ARSEF 1941]|uniref:Tetratricopeptide-like helical n=1 Tax=Metarhizium album (strain ARSEF 1941) TaxID=1081103 RepID=A0A0B2X074_METAS|nr:Tetratricopeptide-like helical [Metarhizium album ARSEF 1941]KHN99693.1 Tetratricopeptide-like helical [Metarhizium album ARSEF 1941]